MNHPATFRSSTPGRTFKGRTWFRWSPLGSGLLQASSRCHVCLKTQNWQWRPWSHAAWCFRVKEDSDLHWLGWERHGATHSGQNHQSSCGGLWLHLSTLKYYLHLLFPLTQQLLHACFWEPYSDFLLGIQLSLFSVPGCRCGHVTTAWPVRVGSNWFREGMWSQPGQSEYSIVLEVGSNWFREGTWSQPGQSEYFIVLEAAIDYLGMGKCHKSAQRGFVKEKNKIK